MRIEVLHVAGCPGTATLLGRLSALTDVAVRTRMVGDDETAAALGMTGSPTLLLDGVDPFGEGAAPSLSCRLYRDEHGEVSGSPSVEALITVLHKGWRFAGTSARARGLPEELRSVHRTILARFLATGRAPALEWLWEQGITPEELHRLSTEDLVGVDAGGVVVAYPFSGVPTEHRVRLAGGPAVWAMCAIDALGIPWMARREGLIESRDSVTGTPIRVSSTGAAWRWEPAGTVVLVARSADGGPISFGCCPHMNFFASKESALSYLDQHGGLSGQVLDQATAIELADLCFGSLLQV